MAEPFLNPDEAMEKRLLSLAENEFLIIRTYLL